MHGGGPRDHVSNIGRDGAGPRLAGRRRAARSGRRLSFARLSPCPPPPSALHCDVGEVGHGMLEASGNVIELLIAQFHASFFSYAHHVFRIVGSHGLFELVAVHLQEKVLNAHGSSHSCHFMHFGPNAKP